MAMKNVMPSNRPSLAMRWGRLKSRNFLIIFLEILQLTADGLGCATGQNGELKVLNAFKTSSSRPEGTLVGTELGSGRYWERPP